MIEQIKQSLEDATPEWHDNGNEIVSKQNLRVGIGGFLKDEDNHLAANAPEWLRYLLGEVEGHKKQADSDLAVMRSYMDELEVKESEYQSTITKANTANKLARDYQKKNEELRKALEKSEKFISAMMEFYGQNLQVMNWHLNGDAEPLDTFFEDNMVGDELEVIREALKGSEPK